MRNSQVYPITAKLESDLKVAGVHPDLMASHKPIGMIVEAVGEYEHGSVDVEDVGVDLKQYAVVALDICLIISSQS